MKYLFLTAFLLTGGLLGAQPIPGFMIQDSLCLDQNPGVQDLRKIFQAAKDSQSLSDLAQIEIKLSPQTEDEKKLWKAARLSIKEGPEGYQGIFEIDTLVDNEVQTHSFSKNRVIELIRKFGEILDDSDIANVEAALLADCSAGHCLGDGFRVIRNQDRLPPESASGNIQVEARLLNQSDGLTWNLDKSVLESIRRYRNAEKTNPHQVVNSQCLYLGCQQKSVALDVSSEDFERALKNYEFFVQHIELLIKQSLSENP